MTCGTKPSITINTINASFDCSSHSPHERPKCHDLTNLKTWPTWQVCKYYTLANFSITWLMYQQVGHIGCFHTMYKFISWPNINSYTMWQHLDIQTFRNPTEIEFFIMLCPTLNDLSPVYGLGWKCSLADRATMEQHCVRPSQVEVFREI